MTHVTSRRDARHRRGGDVQHARMLSLDTCPACTREHDSCIERNGPSGQKEERVMAEKDIKPKAPEKAESPASRTAAARVSKKKVRMRKLSYKKAAK